jgi:anti-sigma regulatory factor (Ser/Thr protein kinase)/GAF domain-containing protein
MAGTDVAMPTRWEQEYPAEPSSVADVRRGLAAFARALGAGEEQVMDITLAVSEAATNAVVHAFATRPTPGTLRIVAEPADGELHVVVADDGHGMKPRGDSPGLGLGLPTIAQVTRSLDIRAGADGEGTEVHMVFSAPGVRAPTPEPDHEAWRFEVLAEVTKLSGASWPGEGVDRLVELLVPAVADACTLDVVEADGPRRVAGTVAGDTGGELSAWLATREPLQDALRSALPSLRSGQVHITTLDREAGPDATADDAVDRMRRLAMAWWVHVPLTDGGVLLGSLGLGLRSGRTDPSAELPFYSALAERAARGLGTRHLVDELRRTRLRLERILSALSEAVTVQDAAGQSVYANDAAARLLGAATPDEVLSATPGELAGRFEITREDGTAVELADLPGHRVLHDPGHEDGAELLTRSVIRRTGAERWLLTKSTRLADDEPFAVNIIEDITVAKNAEMRRRVLAQIGEVLATRTDARAALARIASLAVPALADWCAIDIGERRAAEAGAADQPRSAISVPVRAGDVQVGTLRLATAAGGRMLDADRRAFAEELAGRIASTAQRAA